MNLNILMDVVAGPSMESIFTGAIGVIVAVVAVAIVAVVAAVIIRAVNKKKNNKDK